MKEEEKEKESLNSEGMVAEGENAINAAEEKAEEEVDASDARKEDDEIILTKKEYTELVGKASKLDELQDNFMRKMADLENAKKRIIKEKDDFAKFANEKIIAEFLPVIDNFDRALAHVDNVEGLENIVKGVELIKKQIIDILTANGLEKIESLGKEFNPHFHEAMGTVETDEYPVDVVAEEIQTGYLLKGKLLRPSWVRVACAKSESNAEKEQGD